MAAFSAASAERLATCDERLQAVCNDLIERFDFSVLCGHRGRFAQEKAFLDGFSKVRWPDGKHNKQPSLAVDIAPYPIDWSDHERCALLAGMFIENGRARGFNIRWGGDFDQDTEVKDGQFLDRVHFELVE